MREVPSQGPTAGSAYCPELEETIVTYRSNITIDELLDAHIKALDLSLALITRRKIPEDQRDEAIGLLRASLQASRDLAVSRARVARLQ
jgi:hypothetical protein